jgi:hypothetical protein
MLDHSLTAIFAAASSIPTKAMHFVQGVSC